MIDFDEFLESRFGNDHGEAKARKASLDFLQKRKEGAAKIAAEAKSKGTGPSQLTAWHFEAKRRPYEQAIQAVKDERDQSYFRGKVRQAIGSLHPESMTQQKFQEVMGEIEVWGETFCRIFPK